MHIEIQEPRNKIKFVSISFEKSSISFPGIRKYKEVKQQFKAAKSMPSSTFTLVPPISRHFPAPFKACSFYIIQLPTTLT